MNLKKKAGDGPGAFNTKATNGGCATKRGRPVGSGKGPLSKKQKRSQAAAKEDFDDGEDFSEDIDDNEEKDDSETEEDKLVKVEKEKDEKAKE